MTIYDNMTFHKRGEVFNGNNYQTHSPETNRAATTAASCEVGAGA